MGKPGRHSGKAIMDPRLREMEKRFTEYTLRAEATAKRQRDIITRLTEQHVVALAALESIAGNRATAREATVAATALEAMTAIGARWREAAAAEENAQGSTTPQQPEKEQ